MIEKQCECCGKSFLTYESNHRRFCSKTCALKTRWKNKEKAKTKTFLCENCGNEFKVNASETRVKNNAVRYCSAKCRDEARKTGKIINCKNCGKEFYSTRNIFCSQKCAGKYRSKNYVDRKTYEENGYYTRYINGYNKKGNAKVHRLVMEDHIGRKLTENEIVHHIDGDRKNNDIDNLKIMTRGEHSRLHRQKEIKDGKILFKKSN